jgi:hypothetical protein
LPVVRSQRLGIHYVVEGVRGEDLARVELWYGSGESGPWQLYDYDSDRVSPVEFLVEHEGVHRFLVVAVDRWGRRSYGSQDSGDGVRPQQVVFVDYTSPKLYLYSPRDGETVAGGGELRVRWSGYDAYAGPYPVALFYQVDGRGVWEPMATSLPASGEYGWVVPEQLEGSVRVKVEMRDLAGNVAREISGPVRRMAQVEAARAEQVEGMQAEQEEQLSEAQREEVERWIRRGNLHSERGEWGQAVEAYKRALEVDGGDVSAGVNLANAYYRQGRYERAQQEYERCLRLHPGRESALFGLAQSQITLGQPARARETLEELLEQDQRDWQAWLLYGNVSAELGDREGALTGWQHASDDLSPVRSLAMEQLRCHRP